MGSTMRSTSLSALLRQKESPVQASLGPKSDVCVHGLKVGVIARGTAGGREPVGLFFAVDLVVNLLLNGTSLVTRDGAEDARVRVPYPRALC